MTGSPKNGVMFAGRWSAVLIAAVRISLLMNLLAQKNRSQSRS